MNLKQRKAKKIGAIVLGLGFLIQFVIACIYGRWEEWAKMSYALTGCIMAYFACIGVSIHLDIDKRFNRLEKLIDEIKASQSNNQQNP